MQVVDGVMKTNVAAGKDLSEQHLSKRKRPSSMEGGRGCTVRLLIGYFETLTRPLVDCASSHLISSHLISSHLISKQSNEKQKLRKRRRKICKSSCRQIRNQVFFIQAAQAVNWECVESP